MAVPNLDAMDLKELYDFAAYTRVFSRKKARVLFGDPLPAGHKRAFKDLKNYTWNIITAKSVRQRGESVQTALMYEGIADRIYQGLPSWAKW